MFVETIKVDGLANSSYVVGSEQSGQCAVLARIHRRRGSG